MDVHLRCHQRCHAGALGSFNAISAFGGTIAQRTRAAAKRLQTGICACSIANTTATSLTEPQTAANPLVAGFPLPETTRASLLHVMSPCLTWRGQNGPHGGPPARQGARPPQSLAHIGHAQRTLQHTMWAMTAEVNPHPGLELNCSDHTIAPPSGPWQTGIPWRALGSNGRPRPFAS